MRNLSFAMRTALAVGLSTAVVVASYAWVLHHSLQRAAAQWERDNVAAIAHHLAGMLEKTAPGQRAARLAELSEELGGFGVTVRLARSGAPAEGLSSQVPLGHGGEAVVVSAAPGAERLGSRLAPLYLSLALTLSIVLFLVVQAAAYWGLVRPVRGLSQQLRRMRRGPWRTVAQSSGPEELVSLSREVEETGEEIEHQILEWVEAERRASAELTQCHLRVAAQPHLREIGRAIEKLLARNDYAIDRVAALLRAESDMLAEIFTFPLDRIIAVPAEPLPGDLSKEASR